MTTMIITNKDNYDNKDNYEDNYDNQDRAFLQSIPSSRSSLIPDRSSLFYMGLIITNDKAVFGLAYYPIS